MLPGGATERRKFAQHIQSGYEAQQRCFRSHTIVYGKGRAAKHTYGHSRNNSFSPAQGKSHSEGRSEAEDAQHAQRKREAPEEP